MIEVRSYEDGNDNRGTLVGVWDERDERAARKAAARALGSRTLRGAASWPTANGVVYQFGRHSDVDRNQCVSLTYYSEDP